MKYIVGFQGKVVNVVGAPPMQETEVLWPVADDYLVSVGDDFDHKNASFDGASKNGDIDEVKIGIYKMLERHEMAARRMVRAFRRMGAAANTAADAEGLPQSVDVPDLTTAQFRELAKTFIP